MTSEREVSAPEVASAAARWAECYACGMSASEKTEFKAWLAADPEHPRALARANQTRVDCDWVWQAGVAEEVVTRLADRAGRRSQRRRLLAGAGAAGLLLALGLTWQAGAPSALGPPTSAGSSFVVVRPERTVLPDGSVVELKGDARITTDFSGKVRAIALLRGTAYFEVAKNPERPFVVQAGQVAVRAVGTAFALELSGGDELSVLVTEGRVGVHAVLEPAAAAAAAPSAALVSLDAGKAVSVPVAGPLREVPAVQPLDAEEMRQRTAWRVPRLEFSAAPLRDVVAQMNPHNPRQFVLADDAVGLVRVSGVLSADKADTLAEMLEAEFPVSVERHPDRIVLRRKR